MYGKPIPQNYFQVEIIQILPKTTILLFTPFILNMNMQWMVKSQHGQKINVSLVDHGL